MPALPTFKPTKRQQLWIDDEHRTAKLVQMLWQHGSMADRNNPAFLMLLIRCSWVNGGSYEACREWRNEHLAEWLGLRRDAPDKDISAALRKRLSMSTSEAKWLVDTPSGITGYYAAHRTKFLKQVRKNAKTIRKAFVLVSNSRGADVEKKIEQVASLILKLPLFSIPSGGKTSMMNGLSPVLACLDPQCRFPIMNARTKRLLSSLGKDADSQGALSLSRLIGQKGIKDSLYLDVYAATRGQELKPAKRVPSMYAREPRMAGLKNEEKSVANYAKRKGMIRKQHNALINQFLRAVEWRYMPKEAEYDLLIENWELGRWLLIEAKTELNGILERAQLRQAIGQLFDYRWRSLRKKGDKVDLALLTPSKPDKDVLGLLDELGIEALWFEEKKLTGTISLI